MPPQQELPTRGARPAAFWANAGLEGPKLPDCTEYSPAGTYGCGGGGAGWDTWPGTGGGGCRGIWAWARGGVGAEYALLGGPAGNWAGGCCAKNGPAPPLP
eukprot:scaffold274_cov384-Prasinococcus_capsulatus_cf.AAC.5